MDKRRGRGRGTLRQRKDGRWEGRIVIGYDESGLPITKNVLAKTKGECEEKLARLKDGLSDSGKNKCTPSMPFGEWMDYWYRTYCKESLAETTQMTYEERIYKQIIPKIGKTPLNQITTGLLEKFYAHLKADGRLIRREQFGPGLSNAVIRSIHAHCGAALEKAKKEKLIFKNPAEKCKLPPKKSPEMQILRADEMRRLLIQAYEDGFYEMFLLDLSTGIRRGELLALQWSDVDLKKRTIRICKQVKYIGGELKILPPKTQASNRTINIPPQLASVLGEYRERVDSIWLFPSPVKEEDLPRDPSAVRKAFSKILERAQCKHVPFHALRHTFASNSFHYGMDVKMLATAIGHGSVETTMNVYAHATEEMQRAAARKIDEAIGKALGGDKLRAEPLMESGATDRPSRENAPEAKFEAYKGKKRKPGKGYVKQLSANCWQGRYTPTIDGKRVPMNIYATTEKECEDKLAELIQEVQAERKAKKQSA